MVKKQSIFLFSLLVFTLVLALPLETFAQTYSREWRTRSSTISKEINNLDDEKVMDLPVPILFGVTPDNITSDFGDQRVGHLHEGQDILAPKRAPVVTPTDAVVIRVGVGDSAGNYVYTANPGDETFAYLHLDEIADISEGDVLQKGELIGYVGNTGNASGGVTHLHFEIRNDGDATDPLPRLTRIFPLADKIKYLEDILDNSNNEKELAEFMVKTYRKELVLAQTFNIVLPTSITEALTNKTVAALSITRTLRVGSVGDDVKLLQTTLGIYADGVFGPKTKTAVVAFQVSKGLTADGVFGPVSRAALTSDNQLGCTSSTVYSPTTGAKCIH